MCSCSSPSPLWRSLVFRARTTTAGAGLSIAAVRARPSSRFSLFLRTAVAATSLSLWCPTVRVLKRSAVVESTRLQFRRLSRHCLRAGVSRRGTARQQSGCVLTLRSSRTRLVGRRECISHQVQMTGELDGFQDPGQATSSPTAHCARACGRCSHAASLVCWLCCRSLGFERHTPDPS